ncbi:MAG: PAS domain S-box protein [Bacteroidales bacterium]|nr:PAS domain S-box protein [Bacteroidales bacterium]
MKNEIFLLIDDQKDNLVSLSVLIKQFYRGCRIITATTVSKGIKLAASEEPDVIILDKQMPQMDGFIVCEKLKKDLKTEHIPVIMLTARRIQKEERIRGLGKGVISFLTKPIDDGELLAQLNVAVRIRRAEEKLRGNIKDLKITVEEEMLDSEKRYRTLVEKMNDGLCVVDENALITFVNDKLSKMWGYAVDEIIGHPVYDFLDEANQKILKEQLVLRKKGEKRPYEIEWITKNGDKIPTIISPELVYNEEGRFQGSFSVITDITSIKRALEIIKEQRDRAQKYLDVAGVMFIALNTEGKVTLINNRGCEILEYDEKEVLGKNWVENFLPEHIRKQAISVSKKLLRGETENAEHFENPILTKQGEERLISWHNVVLTNENGDITGHLSSGEDITDERKVVEELKKKIFQIEKFNKLAVNRELRMIELKQEVNELLRNAGLEMKY